MKLGGKVVLGVDIGHAAIKVAGVKRGARPSFVGCKAIEIDSQAVKKDGFENIGMIADKLMQAVHEAAPRAIHTGLASVVLPEAIIFRKIIDLPAEVAQEELSGVVRLQAAEYLPAPLEDMELDYRLVGFSADKTTQQVMVVAAGKKIINDYCAVFNKAKLELIAIDTKPAAIGRAGIKPDAEEMVIMVDIGSEVSTISAHHGGVVQVTSTLNQAANSLLDPATGQIDEEKGASLTKRLAQGLSDEIEHVIKFYTNRSLSAVGGSGMSIRIAGGGSLVAGIDQIISQELALPVQFAEPILTVHAFYNRRYL